MTRSSRFQARIDPAWQQLREYVRRKALNSLQTVHGVNVLVQLRRGTRPTAKATKSEEPAVTRRTFNRYRPAGSTTRTTTSSDFDEASEGVRI